MKHLGDITRLSGSEILPVNVIIGGSPCQDLSIAGKRKGLSGERSGLFMEQIRLIKEMRTADADRGRTGKDIRPRYMVWENVPGAFSSNKGADFGAVLQETIRIVCEEAPAVPMPKNGWSTAGCLADVGGQWSVAWRVFDAQFWGVPQHRRRIALVADFGGITAPEVLFERESMHGNPPQGRETRETTSTTLENGSGRYCYCIQGNAIDRADTAGCNGKGWKEGTSYTLNTVDRPAVVYSSSFRANQGVRAHGLGFQNELAPTLSTSPTASVVIALENNPVDGRVKYSNANKIQTLVARMGTGGATHL